MPHHRFITLPLSAARFPLARVQVSSFGSRLTVMQSRIEFVILRTNRSPPVAPYLASRQRSYIRLRAGERMPEEDLHLSNTVRFQAHCHWSRC